ncbi:metallophosphoesterase family protein [Elusimicrobiota bacterium]
MKLFAKLLLLLISLLVPQASSICFERCLPSLGVIWGDGLAQSEVCHHEASALWDKSTRFGNVSEPLFVSGPYAKNRFLPRSLKPVVDRSSAKIRSVPRSLHISSNWRTEKQISRVKAGEGAGKAFKFIVLGDSTGQGNFVSKIWYKPEHSKKVFKKHLGKMSSLNPGFSMHVGDMTEDGMLEQFDALAWVLDKKVAFPFLTNVGNHDLTKTQYGSLPVYYNQFFGDANYYFDYKGFRFICVDSSDDKVDQSEMRWLEKTLKTKNRIFVFTHKPPVDLSMWTKWLWIDKGGFREGSKEFTGLMQEYEVERVYMGHIHGFGVTKYKDVRYRLTAGGGSPLYPWKPVKYKFYHFIEVSVSSDGKIMETVYKLNGNRKGDGEYVAKPISDFDSGLTSVDSVIAPFFKTD